MNELHFSIPVAGTISIDHGKVTISIQRSDTVLDLNGSPLPEKRIKLPKGSTLFDVVLKVAQGLSQGGMSQFTAAELYHKARETYPTLKRNSFASHVIACAPSHPSHKYYKTRRDNLIYSGNGKYRLNPTCAANQPLKKTITLPHKININGTISQ